MYNETARETAINRMQELIVKLANMRPNDEFDRNDIRATMMYLQHFSDDLKRERKKG